MRHVGVLAARVDKDSMNAFNDERNTMPIANGMIALTPAQCYSVITTTRRCSDVTMSRQKVARGP